MRVANCKYCHTVENLYKVGKQYICRLCNSEHCKKYRQTDKGKEAVIKAVRKYTRTHRKRVSAWNKFHRADLPKEICLKCGIDKVHAHHPDVLYPLSVIFLCPLHHKQEHMIK